MDNFCAGDSEARHVVMCDAMRPPSALGCSVDCAEKNVTVCDDTCGSGRHGDYNCDWRGHGSTWRYRFDDVKTALLADEVGKRRGGRVFIGCDSDCKSSDGAIRVCDTICSEDHPVYDTKSCDDDTFGKNCRILLHQHGRCQRGRRLGPRRTCVQKQRLSETSTTSSSRKSTRTPSVDTAVASYTLFIHGRPVEGGERLSSRKLAAEKHSGPEAWCESSCVDADAATNLPLGVSAACNAMPPAERHPEEVLEEPIQEFIGGSLLPSALDSMAISNSSSGDEFDEFAAISFTGDIVCGDLCVFVSSSLGQLGETDATVRSVLTFMPGMRTAIAVSGEDFHLFDRKFGHLPGVVLPRSSSAQFSAHLADQHCGPGIELIYYMIAGSLISRSFTSKDTHSPRGKLPMAYTGGRGADYASRASSRATSILLGFESPVFTRH
eukprot:jgi/Undpi1/5993/HiC_scaffold_2.g01267.m1